MLYTEDFTMRHYVGFSQIGSHILMTYINNLKVPTVSFQSESQITSVAIAIIPRSFLALAVAAD